MNRAWRWLCGAAIATAVLLGFASPAAAHASLLSSDPPAQSVLAYSPTEIRLTFTEPIDLGDDAIRLIASNGTPMTIGPATQDAGSDSITASIGETLPNGSYVVAWAAVSADSHPIRGAFVFSVGAASSDVDDLVDDLAGGAATGPDGGAWLGLGRFASYTGIAALIGTAAMASLLAPSTLRGRRLSFVLFASGHVALIGTIVMISAQASVIGSSFTDWSAVTSTRSGGWWLARLALVAALTALVPWRALLERRVGRALGGLVAAGLLAIVAAGGHAVSGRATGVGFGATLVHLAAMAVWVGGICLVGLVVGRAGIVATAARFSPIALASVAVLALSGAVNGWRQIGSRDAVLDSSYGRWLIVKLAVVVAVVMVAAVTRRLTRRTPPSAEAGRPVAVRRVVLVEAVGIVIVLAATAGLTGAVPPRQTVSAVDVSVTTTENDYFAQIDLLPAVTGGTTMHVTITPPGGGLEQADEISVTIALSDQQIGPLDVLTFPAGPNHVTTNEATFPIPGRWSITVTVRYGEFDQVVFTTEVDITQR